jgi:hypothetical protein
LTLTYECECEGNGTRFVRTLEYQFSGLLMSIANRLLLKRRIDDESAASMLALCEMTQKHLTPTGVPA